MKVLGGLVGGAYFLLWFLLLPLRLLAKGFYEELLERFTPSGQQRKRELMASVQREERMERWVVDTYPGFSFHYCPADPDDENLEALNEDWIWELQSICSEFDEWEEENGPYKDSEEGGAAKTDLIYWESFLMLLPLLAYLALLLGVLLWVLRFFWSGLGSAFGLMS
jgi:hypothetical protein